MNQSDGFIDGLDLTKARQTVIHWPNQISIIVDKYQSSPCVNITHGVQKDAVQNGWDARTDKKHAKNWGMEFHLTRTKKGIFLFSMRDFGTTGLTGRVLSPEELQEDLPAVERWGRFENVAFTKRKEEQALGARGQGKFIFVGASKQYTILYDTLRADGIYRLGLRTVKLTDSPILYWEGDEAKSMLKDRTEGCLQPLTEIGTRVVIVDPIEDLIQSVKSDLFSNYLAETWWEIIEKYKVKISIKYLSEDTKLVNRPKDFIFPDKDTSDSKVWVRDNDAIKIGKDKFRIKRLHIVKNMKSSVDEAILGVAIQRGGMKVAAIEARYVPKDIQNSLYGYVTLDNDLDEELKKWENPEHYSFNFKQGGAARELKKYLENELAKFAREKLGLGVDPRKVAHDRQMNAEKRAIEEINKIVGKLGISGGASVGSSGVSSGEHIKSSIKNPISVEIYRPLFPSEASIRVNYGQSISEIKASVTNNTTKSINIRAKMFLLYGDIKVKEYLTHDFEIKGKESIEVGPFEEQFTASKYPGKGKYSFKCVAFPLEKIGSFKKGYEKFQDHIVFYLEEDPPSKGLFEQCRGFDFPENYENILGQSEEAETKKGYIYRYNINHPAYLNVEDEEDTLTDYLVQIMSFEIPWIDLRNTQPKLFKKEDTVDSETTVRRMNEIVGQLLSSYYSSKA